MRINGPDVISGNKAAIRPAQSSSVVKTPDVPQTDGSLSARLAGLFTEKGLDIPPLQLQALHAELSSLGMNAAEIDSNNAVRALLLQRFSIPLTRELLTLSWENESTIFKGILLLKENALELLGNKRFSGDSRIAVEALVKNINVLFKGEISAESLKFAADDIIDLWAYGLESKLLTLAEGQAGSVSEIMRSGLSEVELALESLMKPHLPESAEGRVGALVEAVREAVSGLRLQVQAIDFSKPEAAQLLREAVEALGERLSVITGEYEALFPRGAEGEQTRVLLTQFIGKSVNMLENRLLAHLLINAAGSDFAGISEGVWSALPLRNIIMKSGMSFEWQLLAWYRSGRDPARLLALLHDDLKGALMDFIRRLRKNQEKGRIKKKLEHLKKESQNLTKHITGRQLSNILNDHGEKRGIYLELPLGSEPGHGHARIRGHGDTQPEKKTLDPENLFLTFEIETSKMGTVSVYMTFSGKTVALRFELEDTAVSAIAKDMHEEIRDALVSRGFAVGSVDFAVRKSIVGSPDDTSNQTENLDIVG